MKLDTFRRLDDQDRRIRQLERTEPEEDGGGGDHVDSDHADAFSALAHTHAGYAPVEHDTAHDDRFALIAHTHAVHADTDHDDRFALLAHVHVVAWGDITGKPSTFAPAEHDADHSDAFSPLAHAHTGVYAPLNHDAAHDDSFSALAHTHAYAALEHDTAHDDRFSLLAHTHAAHADTDHDDRFSLLAHVHDWSVITGKPSTFAPTPQALDWLTDVATAGQASTNVLTYNGTSWGPATIPAQAWSDITGKPATFPPTAEVLALGQLSDVTTAGAASTHVLTYNGTTWGASAIPATPWLAISGKPSTFPPDEHDTAHDDRFSLLAHTHAVHADTDHDDRFSLLAHVHAVAWGDITGKPTTFTPTPETLALGQLSDVTTAGAASTHVLTYNGTNWGASAIPATPWLAISGKPATFPPDPQALDWLTDVATAGQTAGNILSYNGTSWVPTAAPSHADSDHDDRFVRLPGAWQAMTPLVSPWVNSSGWGPARYRLEGDVVRLSGAVERPSGSNQTIFTLPAGYRPTTQIAFPIMATGALGRLMVLASGNINFTTGVATGVTNLEGITFPIT